MFHCDNCGEIEHVLIDGSPVGDRILEGVLFVVTKANGYFVAKFRPEDEPYTHTLNQKLWETRMTDYANDGDCDEASCPKCGEDVDFPGEDS